MRSPCFTVGLTARAPMLVQTHRELIAPVVAPAILCDYCFSIGPGALTTQLCFFRQLTCFGASL